MVVYHPIVTPTQLHYYLGMDALDIKSDWNIIKGNLKQRWTNLTDDDLQYVDGKQDELLGRIQKRTGKAREEVEAVIKEYIAALSVGNYHRRMLSVSVTHSKLI